MRTCKLIRISPQPTARPRIKWALVRLFRFHPTQATWGAVKRPLTQSHGAGGE